MFESIKDAIVRGHIKDELARLDTAFAAISSKAESADPKTAADVKLEVAKAKTILAPFKSESEVLKARADVKAAESDVISEIMKAEEAAKAEVMKAAIAVKDAAAKPVEIPKTSAKPAAKPKRKKKS